VFQAGAGEFAAEGPAESTTTTAAARVARIIAECSGVWGQSGVNSDERFWLEGYDGRPLTRTEERLLKAIEAQVFPPDVPVEVAEYASQIVEYCRPGGEPRGIVAVTDGLHTAVTAFLRDHPEFVGQPFEMVAQYLDRRSGFKTDDEIAERELLRAEGVNVDDCVEAPDWDDMPTSDDDDRYSEDSRA
jgi:hypothetical protein